MLQLKHQEVVAWINSYMEPAHATTKASRSRCMDLIHIWKPAHATTKASRSRCMDVIHIWNLLMLQLKHQEVVAWI